jgi:hypothetical protein
LLKMPPPHPAHARRPQSPRHAEPRAPRDHAPV